jgi:hypothetical protein
VRKAGTKSDNTTKFPWRTTFGTGAEKGAVFGREAGTRGRLQDEEGEECPSSARGSLNAE